MLDAATYTPRLREQYNSSIKSALKEEFSYKNDMMIPRLEKIVLIRRRSSPPMTT